MRELIETAIGLLVVLAVFVCVCRVANWLLGQMP